MDYLQNTGWLANNRDLFSTFWRLEIQVQGASMVSFQGPPPGSRLLTSHTAESRERVETLLPLRGTLIPSAQAPRSRPHLTLVTSLRLSPDTITGRCCGARLSVHEFGGTQYSVQEQVPVAEESGLETGNQRKDESSRGERRVMFVDVLTLSPLSCWACRGQCSYSFVQASYVLVLTGCYGWKANDLLFVKCYTKIGC